MCKETKLIDKFYSDYRFKHSFIARCIDCYKESYMPRSVQKIYDRDVIDKFMSNTISLIEMGVLLDVSTDTAIKIITTHLEELSGKFDYVKYNKFLSVKTVGDWGTMSKTEQNKYI